MTQFAVDHCFGRNGSLPEVDGRIWAPRRDRHIFQQGDGMLPRASRSPTNMVRFPDREEEVSSKKWLRAGRHCWELGPRRDGVDEPNRGPAARSSVRGLRASHASLWLTALPVSCSRTTKKWHRFRKRTRSNKKLDFRFKFNRIATTASCVGLGRNVRQPDRVVAD